MAQLSPGQRGVLEALAESWGPLTVTELAEQTFARQASVSGALRHLRREGLVRALELGRERYYELRDALHCFARPGRELVDCAAAIRRWYAGDRGTRPVVDRVGEGRPRPLGSEAEAEYEEARAILAQSPRIAVGRLRGRLASHRSPIMEAALVLGLERNEQASEAMDRLLTVASARARQTHEALVALAAKTLGDPLASPAARMVLRVLEADAEPGDPRAREALLQAFDGASAGRVGALSDMVLDYPMISRWLAAGADADLGALLLRLRPSRRSPSLELALEVAIASAWHRGRLPELLPASAALDGVLATASARTRELLAHASVVSILESGEPLDADELDAQLRRRLGRDPTESAWPTLAALAELDAARAALVLDLLHREVALQAWAGATGAIQPGDGTPLGPRRLSGEQREACEAVIAAGKYAWIASGRPPEPLAQLLRRVDGRARPDALLDAPGLREAYARLSAPERDLVRAILERRDDREALACLPAEN